MYSHLIIYKYHKYRKYHKYDIDIINKLCYNYISKKNKVFTRG